MILNVIKAIGNIQRAAESSLCRNGCRSLPTGAVPPTPLFCVVTETLLIAAFNDEIWSSL